MDFRWGRLSPFLFVYGGYEVAEVEREAHAGERATLTAVIDEASRILDAALQLSHAERAELAAILTDSIGDGSSSEEVRAAWLAELERRREALARGEEPLVDFDDVMARLRAKVRRSPDRRASTG
jgi:putative addiction module component (TIGR02574 family)